MSLEAILHRPASKDASWSQPGALAGHSLVLRHHQSPYKPVTIEELYHDVSRTVLILRNLNRTLAYIYFRALARKAQFHSTVGGIPLCNCLPKLDTPSPAQINSDNIA